MTLIDRLSKLDGPDREVDALIECEACDEYSFGHRLGKNKGSVIAYFNRSNGDIGHGTYKAPAYTASVDAAIALAERVLPGWNWRVGRTELYPNGWSYVHKYDPSNCDRTDEAACADGKAANPAIALCIALLRAKEASHGE